jgi:hypothetical protein
VVGLGVSPRVWAAPVVAPGWVFEALEVSPAGEQLPLAASLRQWGPSGDLFVVMDRQTFGTEDEPGHRLFLKWLTCSGGAGCPSVVDRPWVQLTHAPNMPWDTGFQPSLAVRGAPGGPKVHVLHRGAPATGCDELQRSLVEKVFSTSDSSVFEPDPVEADSGLSCADRGVNLARIADGQVQACWTHEPLGICQVRCATRPLSGSTWSAPLLANGPYLQEHPWFDNGETESGSGRLVLKRHRSGGLQRIGLSLVDAASEPFLMFPSINGAVDYPVLEAGGDGLIRAAWYDKLPSGPNFQPQARYQVCDGNINGCHQPAHWSEGTGPIVDVGTFHDLARVELGLDVGPGGSQLQAAMMMAKEPGSSEFRIFFSCRRSESEAWRPPVKLVEPDPEWSFLHQNIEYGRPHLVVDRMNNTVHAVWVQRGREEEEADLFSRLVWVRGAINAVCPAE